MTPRAGRNRLEASEEGWKVWVSAPPSDGEANEAVVRTVASALGIAPSRVEIVRGAGSRQKVLHVQGMQIADALAKLKA